MKIEIDSREHAALLAIAAHAEQMNVGAGAPPFTQAQLEALNDALVELDSARCAVRAEVATYKPGKAPAAIHDGATGERISPAKALKLAGMTIEDCDDTEVPPCCSQCAAEGTMTEPDGTCEHGHPSVLVALGWI